MAGRNKEKVNLDDILVEVGQLGKFQLINYSLIVIPILFSALYGSQFIFSAAATDYRCLVPECDSDQPSYREPWWAIALPSETEARCNRFVPNNTTIAGPICEPSAFMEETMGCDAWVYSTRDTIVAEFDLGCEEWKWAMVGTAHNIGALAALPITGFVSDRFGRRITLCLTAVNAGLFGLIRSFTTSYNAYISLEFLEATLGSGVYSTGFILALELVGPSKRVIGGNIIAVFFALGQVILALVAWWLPDWRTLLRVIYAPSLLFFVYYFFVVESVRWLLSKGRKEEAVEIIKRVAKTNNKTLSKSTLSSLENETEETEDTYSDAEKKSSLALQVIRSKIILIRVCVCSFWWITVTFVYYGLSINSVTLAGNSYVNFMLTSLVEVPGYLLSVLTLDRFGRKPSIMTSFFICGISLISLPFIPETVPWVVTVLSMLGKLCISMTFSGIYIYTSELFPTYTRHSLLGFCSMVGRIGSIVAPQTPLLAIYMPSLPYILFGSFSIAAGLIMMITPETLHSQLPDTISEAEDIANLKTNVKPV